ncbi:MAG: TAXI family TRAP transporter solute-binding subunit [Deltaproteobacteria bacterium]|nr:TAXI family TRAP transporter solute-binding subunit [Deltaproteobacteria bacterium]
MKTALISLAVFTLIAAGTAAGAPIKPLIQPVSLKIQTPPAVTATYPAAVFIAEIIKKNLPSGSTVLTIPAPGIELVVSGKADLYISTHAFMQMGALRGDSRLGFKQSYPGTRAIAQLADKEQLGVFQFVVTKDTDLRSLDDVKAKMYPLRLATSVHRSIAEVTTKTVLSYYGITYGNIRSWGGRVDHIGWREAVDAAKEGRINALSANAQYPYPYFVELAVNKPVTLLSLSNEVIAELEKDLPGLERHTIPAPVVKDYRGVDRDVQTVATGFLIVVRAGLPDEVVYALTKIIIENYKSIAEQYAGHKYFTPQIAVRHLSGFPLHPMAELYYKEMGILK